MGVNEYAFLINENKYDGEINSIEKVLDFLTSNYLENRTASKINIINDSHKSGMVKLEEIGFNIVKLKTDFGVLKIKTKLDKGFTRGDEAYNIAGEKAKDGKYIIGWPAMWNYIIIKDGKVDIL
ncbi:hypothetical protein [Leeuwenhoekiella sp. MAR_2009_132]|uniref:hypothetical protein n=1 Tax=Leeuwenhoekiella sp. MAR_2009_132 TaxID=1392489 RepID=UPI00048CC2F1|nr:hypothetical protein [Leeuwenhoekiella sp. MAR_2009_132]